jgi:hypothetical protein
LCKASKDPVAKPRSTPYFALAANRDRRQFDLPQKFDISRSNNRHLAFGFGIHHVVVRKVCCSGPAFGTKRMLV